VLRLKVGVGKLAVHLRVRPRDREADTREHVVRRDPVDVMLVHLGAHHDAVVVLFLLPLPLTGPLLANVLCPPRGIVILGHFLEVHVRVYRPRSPPSQRHGASSPCRGVGGKSAASGDYVIRAGVRASPCGELGHLQGVAMLQAIGLLGRVGVAVEGGRRRHAVARVGDLQAGRGL
jgi:hypothetical protein